MAKQLLAIVRGERIANKSAKGKPAYAQMKGLMNYIAYGRYEDQLNQEAKPRGLWLDHNGNPAAHEETLHWAKEKVHRYGYEHTYQLLLSTRYGGLTAADFNHVLKQGSELSDMREWRMMLHEDTDNQHAHVILLRREKLANGRYKEWQQKMQLELEQLQAQRHQERQLETAMTPALASAQEDEVAQEQARHEGWEIDI